MNVKLSIVVPAYNEEVLISDFIKEVTSYLQTSLSSYELLIVENGSKDKTLKIAHDFAKRNKRVLVIHLSEPSFGRALMKGFEKSRGEYVVVFNVDFWDPKFIDLAKVDLLGYDLVVGSKSLPGSDDRRPFLRKFVTFGFNFLLKVLFGFQGTDTHGIKIFNRQKIGPIVKKCRTKTGIFDSELLIRAQRAGLKILELPVEVMEKRPNRFGIKRVISTPLDIWQLWTHLR